MTEAERADVQKAFAYDLINIIEENPEKNYTAEEVKQLIKAYVAGTGR